MRKTAAERQADWRLRNPGVSAKRCRDFREANPERAAASFAKWRAANPDSLRARNARQRARIVAAPGHYTDADIAALVVSQGGVCAGPCEAKLADGYHADHIMPLARGGSNWPANIQLLCPRCNTSKGAKTMEEWAPCLI